VAASSPGLRIVATSRDPLRVTAETVWQVPPLSLPPDAQTEVSAGGIWPPRSDALKLFADRAATAQPGFTLGPGNLAAVTGISRSLDGLPVAIELAAAWVRMLTVEQIAARLDDRFRLLSSSDRVAVPRHRTFRAAIDWSHDLLSLPEQILLRRLSVFVGWSLEMAEGVCAYEGGDGIPVVEIIDLLTALADKLLVIADNDPQGMVRYRMLDTIRAYAAAGLTEAGESARLHDRFREYAAAECERLALIAMAQVSATWADRVAAIHWMEVETPDLRLLLGRMLVRGDAESGLRADLRPCGRSGLSRGSSLKGLTRSTLCSRWAALAWRHQPRRWCGRARGSRT
jgi:predicted ATPase